MAEASLDSTAFGARSPVRLGKSRLDATRLVSSHAPPTANSPTTPGATSAGTASLSCRRPGRRRLSSSPFTRAVRAVRRAWCALAFTVRRKQLPERQRRRALQVARHALAVLDLLETPDGDGELEVVVVDAEHDARHLGVGLGPDHRPGPGLA